VVLLGEPLIIIPGGSSARVQLLDRSGKSIGAWSFQAGWRLDPVDASIGYSKALESNLIVLSTARVINGRDIAKEYFAVDKDRLRLVRLENSKGEGVQNEYVLPNYEIGIVPDAKNVDQFAGLLESSDKADILSALVFLGGSQADGKYATLFQQLMDSPRIHALIERLTASDNEWTAQAAKLAARGPHERPLN
jgi:hypothetical protein